MKLECVICQQCFRSEETLNCHLLFTHNQWRGYCENPHSKTYFDETKKILRDLKRIGKEPLGYTELGLIRRLDDIGYGIPIFLNEHQKYFYGDKKWRVEPYMGYSETSKQKRCDYEDKLEKEKQLMDKIIKEENN